MKTKVCVIGNGQFTNTTHLPILTSFEDVELAGIFAFNEKRLRASALQLGLNENQWLALHSPTDYQQHILRLQPDAVYVLGQPDQMFPVWTWCLHHKFHLYIEKPMGLTWHQANVLTSLAHQNNCITQVSLQRRSSPILQRAMEHIWQRGPVTHAVVSFSKYDPAPMLGARDRMLDDFIHCIDTARWICKSEVVKVESGCRRLQQQDINWIGATLHFETGATCYAIGNWHSGRRLFKVEVHAPGIYAEVDPEKEARIYADGNYDGEVWDTKTIAGSEDIKVYGGFMKKHREFIDSVQSGVEHTSSPFSDVLKTMQVCESILAQSLLNSSNA